MNTAKVDFNAIIAGMKKAGAFDVYDKPLGDIDAKTVNASYQNPHFPGDTSYGVALQEISYHGHKIPQDLVNAQKHSLGDALDLYMPQEQMGNWMHEYFSGDFLHSAEFSKLAKDMGRIQDTHNDKLADNYTMKLAHKSRLRNDRKMFTEEEADIARDVSQKLPALPITVIGYQSAFVSYLHTLDAAIMASDELSDTQKKQGHKVASDLARVFDGPNFYQSILLSVALHYRKNHGENSTVPPTQEDFNEGMRFILKNGSFRRKVEYPDKSGSVLVVCPAQKIISKSTTLPLEDSPAPANDASITSQMGIALHHIYRVVDKRIDHDPALFAGINGDMQELFERAIPARGAAR